MPMIKHRSVLIGFIIAVISSAATWVFTTKSYDTGYELVVLIGDTAQLEYHMRLLVAEEKDLKCHLAKMANAIAADLEVTTVPQFHVIGAPGMNNLTQRDIDKALSDFNQTDIKAYAQNCKTNAALY